MSDYWFNFSEGKIATKIDNNLIPLIRTATGEKVSDRVKQYATIFYKKNSDYLKKTNNIILGDTIKTKLIRMSANNLSQNEQIILLLKSYSQTGILPLPSISLLWLNLSRIVHVYPSNILMYFLHPKSIYFVL